MQVVSYGNHNIVVSDNPHYPFFEYDAAQSSFIKVVNPKVTLNWFEEAYPLKSNYYGRKRNGTIAFGISVIYSFSKARYCYFCYHLMFEALVRDNFSSLEVLEVSGDFRFSKIRATALKNYNSSVVPVGFYEDDFPFIDFKQTDFDSLPQYQFQSASNSLISTSNNLVQTADSNLNSTTSSFGPAICACGYINEFVENDPNYVCQQCKLWNHIAS